MSLPAVDSLRKPEPPMRSESTKLSSAHPSTHGSIGKNNLQLIDQFLNRWIVGHSAQTLQLNRKKSSGSKQTYNSLQRHSSGGNLDYDNVENDCAPSSGPRLSNMGSSFGGNMTSNGSRSRTLGDGLGKYINILWLIQG